MGDAEEQKAYLLFLENRTYRYLQHLAKALSLPSNYKRVYLIELIYAKKYRTEEIVKTIIQRVRIERLLAAKNRMRRNRRKRFTMPPRTKSPAISATPKRQRVYVPFSSDLKTVMRNTTRRSLLDVIKQNTLPRASDRVLRSFSLRQSDNSNYNRSCLINNSECNKVQNALNTKAVVKVNIPTGNFYKYYMNTECVVKKHRPAILNSTCNETRKPLILRQRLQDVGVQSNITAARRQRTISGIYPLPALTNCPQPVQTTEGASMRNYDGSRTKLNAVIQKCNTNYKQKITYCNTEVNIQDLIDSIDGNIENEDMQSHRTVENSEPTSSPSILNSHEQYTEPATSYSYHIDRMRYQMMYDRSSQYTDEPVLPKINEVFSNINCMQNIAQPLYVQVSSEDELSRNYPLFADNCNTELLESLYNFKNQMLTNVPLLQIATTDNTRSTYSTSTVTTARVHHSASHGNDYYDYNPFELDNRYMNDPRLYEFFRYSQQQRNSALNRSSSSTETYHERSTPATVPEMLEDAVELISQDGDYMEQIGMDVRVLCVLCEWAGPNILLENHILKEHGMSVVECEAGVGVSWSLAALWRACACVLRRATALYVLRARYSDPDRLSAQLAVSTVMSVVECEAGVGVSWSLAALWRACACVLRRATALYVLRARYSDPDRLSAQLAVSTVMSVVECEAGVGVSWSLAALWRACACVLRRATALYVLRARYSDPDRLSAQLAVSTVMSVVECEAGVGVSWSLAALWRVCACVLRRATALYVLRARYSDPDRLSAQLAVSTVMSVVECEAGVGVSWSLATLWRACACVLRRATALYVLRARYSDPDRLSAQLAVSTVMSVVECEAGVGVSWSLAALWRACACVLRRATALYVLRARYSDPDRLSAQLAVSTVMSVVECEAGVGVSWSLATLWRACACVLRRATALYVLRARYSDPDRLSAQLAVSTVMSVVECEAGVGVSWSLAALWRACACVLRRATALYVLRARYSDPDRLSAQLAVSTVMSVVECEAGVGVSWSLAALWRACACVLRRATALYVLRARCSDPDRLSAQLAVSTVMSVVECEAGVGVSWSLATLWRACACVLRRATALYVLRARYSDPDRLSAQLAVSTVMSVVECEAGVGVSWSLAALWRACACVMRRATALYVLRARYSDPDCLSAQLAVSTVMSVVECEAGVGVSWSLAALWRACACVLRRATALYVLRARYSDPDRLSAQLAMSTVMSVVECEAGVGVSWSLAALWRACACVLRRATALYVLRARYSDPDRLSAQLAVSTVMSVVECEAGVGVSWSLAALWRACACVLRRATALYVLRARYSDPDRLSAQLVVSTVMSVVECEAGVGVSWALAALWRACACVLRRATALYVLRARYSDPDRLSAQLAVSTVMSVVECEAGVGVSWSLAALWRACACVLRRATALYVLRARYSDPDRLSAQLATISADPVPRMGEITVYNKRTGEPYSWTGYIQPLTYSDDSSGLQVSVTHLDLLPNSANLKLLNRELVSYSLNRAVVGAPALNDINVVFNVKIE